MIRHEPCSACPYRQDCPSGVWAASEYEKLIPYDGETWEQPFGLFMCHATEQHVCHGWAVVSGEESLALRLHQMIDQVPDPAVPLFASHTDAAMHGLTDLEAPSTDALVVIDRLTRKYPRLREWQASPTTRRDKRPNNNRLSAEAESKRKE